MVEASDRPRLFLKSAALALILATATAAVAQETPIAIEPASNPPASTGNTLVIVADAEPESKAKTIETRVRRGASIVLQEAKLIPPGEQFPANQVRAEQLDPDTYEVLRRFITEGTLPRNGGDDRLSMLPDQKGAWRLNLGGPFALKDMDVVYEDPKTKERKTETIAPGPDGRVKIITPGRYLVHVFNQADPERRPIQFVVRSFDGEKDRPELKIDVPRENTYWQVVVQDFAGDQKRLFEVLADPEIFANPLVSKKLSERKLVLGSMVLIDRYGDVNIAGNTVTFTFYKPPGSKPTRVWMKFPIEPEEVEKELAAYRKLDEFELPARIREENPSLADEPAPLRPRPEPARWHEIPLSKDGVSFERSFELDQLDAWKARKNKGVHQLIVWQLDDGQGGNAQAYILADPVGRTKAAVKAEEVTSWPVKIQEAGPPADR